MIDWTRVETLKSEVGTEDFNEILDMFIEELDETISQIVSKPDQEISNETFHFLKSGALNIGFAEFAALSQKGEQGALNGEKTVSAAMLADSYERSKLAYAQGSEGVQASSETS